MKSVCIIGAGPAGLVAAKTFLQKGGYAVTLFEAAERAGGMWRAEPGEDGDKCSPDMRTNLSRFTVAFADLSWSSVDLSDPTSDSPSPPNPPLFPKAWQVGRYLRHYAQTFGLDTYIKYDTRVASVKPSKNLKSWEVTSISKKTQIPSSTTFDCVVIASGFFGKPMLNNLAQLYEPMKQDVQHSSMFRDIISLKPGKIAIIGGGISGSEAAAHAAFQVSNHKNTPGKIKSAHADTKIYHIINRPFYCLPRYLPVDPHNPDIQDFNLAPKFLPLDLVLYNLSRRGDGGISASITTVPSDKAKKGHEFMRSVIGGDQRDLGHSELVYRPEHTQYPGYTGITDIYSEFVRSGIIIPVQGWADKIDRRVEDGTFSLEVTPREPWRRANTEGEVNTVTGITGIVEATGYETDIDFLDNSVKELLDFDPSCPRLPFLLTRGSIFAQKLPNLGFVGFYEGPFWSVMEMQARLIAESWSKDNPSTTSTHSTAHSQQADAEQMRDAIKQKSLRVPQFWMMDYVGLVEELSRATGIIRDDTIFGGQHGPAFAARYAARHASEHTNKESSSVVKEVFDVIKASEENARFVAAAVFRGMQGIWKLRRKIDSRNAASPGGIFSGVAHFHPRKPTDPNYSAEYLYIEEGTFKMDTGLSFPATRRYIYRYSETYDKITAWFADEDGESVGALFNTWDFYSSGDSYRGWLAKGHHWCDPDTYKNTCEFRFRAATLQTFGITYQVEGPRKDYSHESWYERPVNEYK